MTLLDEVIIIAVDTKQSLPVLLRKCLLLAYELKNDHLKSWANQELNGYAPAQELPDYRIVYVGARANFTGYFGREMRNWPIPPAMLEERHRDFARKLCLRQAISCYESASISEEGSLTYAWPGDLCLYYQDKLVQDFALVNAWRSISRSGISGMLDTIRNRTLNMALELKADMGDTNSVDKLSEANGDKVNQAVTHNIFHGPAYFASGESQLSVITSGQQIVITEGNLDALNQALLKSGLSQPDVQELATAIQHDGKGIGSSVQSWIKKTAPKLLAGGAKVSSKIAQSLITEWLNQYFGLG
jgi:AbiTii